MGYSVASRRQNNRVKDLTPADLFERDTGYFYRLGSPDSEDQYFILKTILGLLENDQSIINFSIERVATVAGVFGDNVNMAQILGYKTRVSNSFTVKNYSKLRDQGIRDDEIYLITPYPLEEYVDELGFVNETPRVPWYINSQLPEFTQNDGIIYNMETMNSFDWEGSDANGIKINKEIILSLVNRRGVNVSNFTVTTEAHALWALPSGISFLDDDNVSVDWDVDWDKTDFLNHDIAHITTEIKGQADSLQIKFEAIRAFKFWKWIEDNSVADLGVPYSALNYDTSVEPPTGIVGLLYFTNEKNSVQLTGSILSGENSDTTKQIETEFFDGCKYRNFLHNSLLGGVIDWNAFNSRDLDSNITEDDENNIIRTILPAGVISETPALVSITYTNGEDAGSLRPPFPPEFDNPNIDLNPWWATDWKLNKNATDSAFISIGTGWYKGATLKVIAGLPRRVHDVDEEYVKNTINNLITGKTSSFKGIQLTQFPNELEDMERPEYYSDYTSADSDYYSLTTFDLLGYYNRNKDYYENIAPTRTVSNKKYDRNRDDTRYNFLSPVSLQGLITSIFFKQAPIKDGVKIHGKFKDGQILFPRTYDFKFIDGGKYFSIDQYSDDNETPAVDSDGVPVSIISKQTLWYLTKDKRQTRNSGSFAEATQKGKFTGFIKQYSLEEAEVFIDKAKEETQKKN